jgi:hypothetical protein
MTTCPETGKRCYGSERGARKANAKIRNRVRVYFCRECCSFHVTSRVKK